VDALVHVHLNQNEQGNNFITFLLEEYTKPEVYTVLRKKIFEILTLIIDLNQLTLLHAIHDYISSAIMASEDPHK
jgi:hypothetical protein